MTDAITYDLTAEHAKETYVNLKKQHTVRDFRETLLVQAETVLQQHPNYDNVELDMDNLTVSLTEDELIAVMTAHDALLNELEKKDEMTRLEHLKAAITGGM